MCSKFKTKDLVWAKMRYSPFWPAQVMDPPSGKNRKYSLYVFFFGTENFGWVKKADVLPYTSYVAEIRTKNKKYCEGVKKIAQIYHEEIQLNSPTFKKMKQLEQEENGELDDDEPDEELLNSDFEESVPVPKTKGYHNEKEEIKKQKDTSKDGYSQSFYGHSSSSCIKTIKVHEFKKLISKELRVHISRCDEILKSSIGQDQLTERLEKSQLSAQEKIMEDCYSSTSSIQEFSNNDSIFTSSVEVLDEDLNSSNSSVIEVCEDSTSVQTLDQEGNSSTCVKELLVQLLYEVETIAQPGSERPGTKLPSLPPEL